MTDPHNPYGATDPFDRPTHPPQGSPQPPTGPTWPSDSAPPTGPAGDDYVVSAAPPGNQGPYQNAPDPFGGPARDGAYDEPAKAPKNKKPWIIPVASVVALAIIAAAVYFLLIKKDSGSNDAAATSSHATGDRSDAEGSDGSASASESAGSSGASESSSASGSSTASGSSSATAAIAGTYEVNGTIESYQGPQTGQLGGSAKKAGDPAFKAPQTWTLTGECVTGKPCELAITPGDTKVALTIDGGTWKGETTEAIQCSAGGQSAQATITYEIPEAGATAKRTFSAACAQQVTEVDALTLTKK